MVWGLKDYGNKNFPTKYFLDVKITNSAQQNYLRNKERIKEENHYAHQNKRRKQYSIISHPFGYTRTLPPLLPLRYPAQSSRRQGSLDPRKQVLKHGTITFKRLSARNIDGTNLHNVDHQDPKMHRRHIWRSCHQLTIFQQGNTVGDKWMSALIQPLTEEIGNWTWSAHLWVIEGQHLIRALKCSEQDKPTLNTPCSSHGHPRKRHQPTLAAVHSRQTDSQLAAQRASTHGHLTSDRKHIHGTTPKAMFELKQRHMAKQR